MCSGFNRWISRRTPLLGSGDDVAANGGEGISWRGGCWFDSQLNGDLSLERVTSEGMQG